MQLPRLLQLINQAMGISSLSKKPSILFHQRIRYGYISMLKPVSTSNYCWTFFFTYFADQKSGFLALILCLHLSSEKLKIPRDKPRILLGGESRRSTVVQFGDGGTSIESSTFSLDAEEFLAMDITFKVNQLKTFCKFVLEFKLIHFHPNLVPKTFTITWANTKGLNKFSSSYWHFFWQNTHNLQPGNPITWAPAALINADKAAFYRCGFIGVQDTLTDSQGRHYFENCYIEGAMDFIWGNGRSIYQVGLFLLHWIFACIIKLLTLDRTQFSCRDAF